MERALFFSPSPLLLSDPPALPLSLLLLLAVVSFDCTKSTATARNTAPSVDSPAANLLDASWHTSLQYCNTQADRPGEEEEEDPDGHRERGRKA